MFQNRATLKEIRFHLLSELRQIYTEYESDSISRLIMEHAGYPLKDALLHPDYKPGPSVLAQLNEILAEIHTGSPIQYILGYTYFCDLKLKVNKHVLIPRPETEEMMEHIKTAGTVPVQRIMDLGTGSGCIALALKKHFRDAEVWGADISEKALLVAEENGRNNMLQINWIEMNLLRNEMPALGLSFDLVVSNPPYVRRSEAQFMARNVTAFEPGSALYVEDGNPLVFYQSIANFCDIHLARNGEVWAEMNETLGKETAKIFEDRGFSRVRILRDIHGKERYINARI